MSLNATVSHSSSGDVDDLNVARARLNSTSQDGPPPLFLPEGPEQDEHEGGNGEAPR